jgi:hypothetical protein
VTGGVPPIDGNALKAGKIQFSNGASQQTSGSFYNKSLTKKQNVKSNKQVDKKKVLPTKKFPELKLMINGEYRNNNPKWRPTTHNMQDRKQYYKKLNDIASGVTTGKDFYSMKLRKKHATRICYCHEYIG